MNRWKVKFWSPGKAPNEENVFGCTTFGYATHDSCYNPEDDAAYAWNIQPYGEVLSGAYMDVLEKLRKVDFVPKAIIVIFTAKTGMEDFLAACKAIVGNVPIVGGGAAVGADESSGEIRPKGKDVSVLLIAEGEFRSSYRNIHEEKIMNIEIEPASDRVIRKIKPIPGGDWVDAATFYRGCQVKKQVPQSDFETVTLSDLKDRNVHCCIVDNELRVNANLPKDNKMILRTVSRGDATQRFSDFISEKNSLIFGCAGLRTLYDGKIYAGENTFAGFFFGETLTIGDEAYFGNLILSKLTQIY